MPPTAAATGKAAERRLARCPTVNSKHAAHSLPELPANLRDALVRGAAMLAVVAAVVDERQRRVAGPEHMIAIEIDARLKPIGGLCRLGQGLLMSVSGCRRMTHSRTAHRSQTTPP
jgi:hypothetical protein